MRWRCVKCRTVVERENTALTAVYCCQCQCWRKQVRPVGVSVRKAAKRAVARGTGTSWPTVDAPNTVHIPGDCGHYHQMIIEEGPDQTYLYQAPGEAS